MKRPHVKHCRNEVTTCEMLSERSDHPVSLLFTDTPVVYVMTYIIKFYIIHVYGGEYEVYRHNSPKKEKKVFSEEL